MAITNEYPIYGFDSVFIGEIPSDGAMSATLTEVGTTVRNSFTLTSDDLTFFEAFIEESDDPYIRVPSGGGAIRGTWSIYNAHPSALATFFGGIVVGTGDDAIWEAPERFVMAEKSVRAISGNEIQVEMARVQFAPAMNWAMQRENPGAIVLNYTVMRPGKSGTPRLRTGKVAAFAIPVG